MPLSPKYRFLAILAATTMLGALLVWSLTAHLLSPSLDEGIYLQGAHRIVQGQVPYRDFFAFAGPVLYWLLAAIEAFAGRSIPILRLSTAVSIGLIAALVLTIVQRQAGLRAALSIAAFWLGMTIDLWNRLEVNHRWLSMGFYSIALIALLVETPITKSRAFLAGAALSLAAWTTQSFAWPLLLIVIYIAVALRSSLVPFLSGAVVTGAVPIVILFSQGALGPMLESMRWVAVNYTEANRTTYGHYFSTTPARYLPHIWLAILAPPATALLGVYWVFLRKQRDLVLPFVLTLALLPTAYPKWDALQLLFISAPFLALCLALLWRQIPPSLAQVAQAVFLMPPMFFLLHVHGMTDQFTSYSSRAGNLVGLAQNVAAMQQFEDAIPANAKVFVYPYMTSLYPLLHVENPTHYEYLQPGMMTAEDEQKLIADLENHPPEFIFWHFLPDSEVLKIWPNTDPARLHFVKLEALIRERYSAGIENRNSYFNGQIWARKP